MSIPRRKKSKYFCEFNFNKYGQNINDCAIRAVVQAIGMDYDIVCKKLGCSFKRGHGLIRDSGVYMEKIQRVFDEYFDVVENFDDYFDPSMLPPDLAADPEFQKGGTDFIDDILTYQETGLTLEDFLGPEMSLSGMFIVGLSPNPEATHPEAKMGGHVVGAYSLKGKTRFIDTWDSHEMIVDSFMRIKKRVPLDSPLHYKYDKQAHKFI